MGRQALRRENAHLDAFSFALCDAYFWHSPRVFFFLHLVDTVWLGRSALLTWEHRPVTFGGRVIPSVKIHFRHVAFLFVAVSPPRPRSLSTSSRIQSISIRQPSACPFQVLMF